MNQLGSRGLAALVQEDRVEAVLWSRLRDDKEAEAREPLFNRYVGLARSIAARVRPQGCDASAVSDSEQWAYEGLLQAIDTFDPKYGVPFSAYARHRIGGSVRDGFATLSEFGAQQSARNRIEKERLRSLKNGSSSTPLGRFETLAELAVGLALGMMIESAAISARAEDIDPHHSAYDSLEWRQTQARLAREIERLPQNEATIIRQHYEHGLAFIRIAEMIGVTRGRVSQLHKSALSRLKKRMGRGL